MMAYVLDDIKEGVGVITLNRPEKRNALSPELIGELTEMVHRMEENPDVSVVVMKANGKAFCAGADLAYLQSLESNSFEENLEDSQHLAGLFQSLYSFKKPLITAIQGPAIAGGCGLALTSDFIFTVPNNKFGFTEVKIGFVPALVSKIVLLKVGQSKASEMLLSGHIYTSEEMINMGVITKIVGPDELQDESLIFAQKLARENSAGSMMHTKALLRQVGQLSLEESLEISARENAKSRETSDFKAGIAQFLQKRK